MHIVIELSDETYKDIKEENGIYGINNGLTSRITGKVVGAIQNGTPLPKGHGRLIDADDIRVIELEDSLHIIQHKKGDEIDVYIDAPTIIEADKEQE